jgi:CheY-like chemotaxis protein
VHANRANGCWILVVDDQPLSLYLTLELLRDAAGHRALERATGVQEALALVDARPGDRLVLAVLDIMLEDGDGFGLHDALRGRGVACPIVFHSAQPLDAVESRAAERGAAIVSKSEPWRLQQVARAYLQSVPVAVAPPPVQP